MRVKANATVENKNVGCSESGSIKKIQIYINFHDCLIKRKNLSISL